MGLPMRRWPVLAVAVVGALLFGCAGAHDDDRTVGLYLGVPADDPAAEVAHEYARLLSARLQLPVQVRHLPGAGGAQAVAEVVAQPSDGYTLGLASNAELIGPALLSALPVGYSGPDDWTTIGGVLEHQHGLIVMPRAGWGSLPEFVAEARDRPGELAVAVPAPGGPDGLAVATLMAQAGIEVQIVAFDGGAGEASMAVLGEQADALHAPLSSQAELLRAVEMISLGHTGTAPAALGDSPTYHALGYDVPWSSLYYVYAPPGLPSKVSGQLALAHQAVVSDDQFTQFLHERGYLSYRVDGAEAHDDLRRQHDTAALGVPLLREAGLGP